MNVLFVVSSKYKDMDTVHGRLAGGIETEHVTWRLKSDIPVRKWAEENGHDIPVWESEYGWDAKTNEALWNEALNFFDYVIVYSESKSGIAAFMQKKKTELPYSIMYGGKIEVNVPAAKPKATKSKRRAE